MKSSAKYAAFLFASAASSLAVLPSLAQYSGPAATAGPSSVAQILKRPVDDERVTVEGRLLRQLGKERYMFSDGSGEIVVEIDLKRMPNVPINEKTRVRLHGEVEKEFNRSPHIDVDAVSVLN